MPTFSMAESQERGRWPGYPPPPLAEAQGSWDFGQGGALTGDWFGQQMQNGIASLTFDWVLFRVGGLDYYGHLMRDERGLPLAGWQGAITEPVRDQTCSSQIGLALRVGDWWAVANVIRYPLPSPVLRAQPPLDLDALRATVAAVEEGTAQALLAVLEQNQQE